MDEAAMLEEIKSRQQTVGKSDPDSDTKGQTPKNPFENLRQRILNSKSESPPSPTEVAAAQERERQSQIASSVASLERAAGTKYAACSLRSWQADSDRKQVVLEAAIEYCEGIAARVKAGEGVLLYGPVGTGKDHLAMGIARAACMAGLSVKWLRGQEWFGSLRDSMDSDKCERDIFRALACDLLVLSDPLPPMGPLTQYQASMLYRLTEDCYVRGGVIVATVNVSSDAEADARMGAQTWDRMKDRAWQIRCEWKSFRKPARIV